MRRSIIDYSLREFVFRVFQKLGLKTKSEAHFSTVDRPSLSGVAPLLITGLPRSGTTTLLHKSADMLGYNALFEPLVFNHLGLEEELFDQVCTCFRGNPSVEELLLQDAASGLFSDIRMIKDEALRQRARMLLVTACDQMVERCGHSVVVKELRWIANLDIVDELFSAGGIRPKHLLLDPDPFMVLYTHYRLGGLSERNDFNNLAVNEMYDRKIRIARKRSDFSAFAGCAVRNKWEKLIVSILIDRKLMCQFAQQHPDRVRLAGLGELLGGLRAILKGMGYDISEDYQERQVQRFSGKRYLDDCYFLARIQRSLSGQVLELIGAEASEIISSPVTPSIGTRKLFTHLAVTVAEF
jgi:hypothetical protein